MVDFNFPPPRSGGETSEDEEGYRAGSTRPGFLFPPPRRTDGNTPYEVIEEVAGGINDIKDEAAYAANEIHNLGQVVADYGDILERKVEPWAVPTVAPLSSTINRRADPTFQLSDFMVPLVRGRSDQEAHNHTHITTSSAYRMQEGASTKGRVYMAFITPAINRAYSELNFMVGAVTNPCYMDIGVYVVDENRQITRQVGPVRVSDSIGLGEQLATVQFDTWVAVQGSYIAVAWLQHGPGNTRGILGLDDTPRPLTNVVFPRKISAIHRYQGFGSLPTTIDGETNVDFDYWFTPYAELSEAVGVDYKVFNESWAWRGLIGRPWLGLTNPGMYSDGGHVSASGFGTRVNMYDTPVSTDFVRVRTSVNRVFSNNQRRTTIIIRGTNNLRSGVGLSVINGSRYELIQWSNQDPGRNWDTGKTVIRTVNVVPNNGHNLEIDYLDGYVTFRINGIEQFAGQLVGGPEGAAGRFLGLQFERTGDFFVAFPSPWLGPWSARDLPQDEGGGDDETGEGEG